MVYNPATDFVGLWRNIAGQVSKLEMPGLDYVIAALARAGLITVSVSATAPVANQPTTAWLQTAVPSYSAEGTLHLWDPVAGAYAAASMALLLKMLEASAGQNGVSWWATTLGPPANVVGNNGDFAIRTDEPGGVYGPKALGAWPATPLPGTVNVLTSTELDNTFGGVEGEIIYRGPALWQTLPIGAANTMMVSTGAVPTWEALSTLMDVVFGNAQGSILYRDAGAWNDLPPGTAGNILITNGPAANPSWGPRSAEFASGTTMLFQQSAAPTGWTKQTVLNDYGLRVTNGAVSTVSGSPFSTVFAQTVVGNHTLIQPEMPSHTHPIGGRGNSPIYGDGGAGIGGGGSFGISEAFTIGSAGSDGPHSHAINLTLSYVDVIIASKN